MYLTLIHGRHDTAQQMDDWGFNGPVLERVRYAHLTYLSSINVGFEDERATQKAAQLTGWGYADDAVLEMPFTDDLVRTIEDGKACYYGDWEVMDFLPGKTPTALADIPVVNPQRSAEFDNDYLMNNRDAALWLLRKASQRLLKEASI